MNANKESGEIPLGLGIVGSIWLGAGLWTILDVPLAKISFEKVTALILLSAGLAGVMAGIDLLRRRKSGWYLGVVLGPVMIGVFTLSVYADASLNVATRDRATMITLLGITSFGTASTLYLLRRTIRSLFGIGASAKR